MNVKLDFVLREIAGETLLVPAGKTALDLNGMLTLNETGAALWRMLPEAADAEALDRKSTHLNSSHVALSRMPSSA